MREREDEWADLMRSANAGDGNAYQRLLRAITPVLRAGARRGLVRAGQPIDQAEDIVQDVFLALWEKATTFEPARGSAFAWAVTLTRNRAIDRVRMRKRRSELLADTTARARGPPPAEAGPTPGGGRMRTT